MINLRMLEKIVNIYIYKNFFGFSQLFFFLPEMTDVRDIKKGEETTEIKNEGKSLNRLF